MAQVKLKVSGMTCGHCVTHVTDAISSVSGVQSVSVNLAEGVASIELDDELNLQTVKDAVVAAGYSV